MHMLTLNKTILLIARSSDSQELNLCLIEEFEKLFYHLNKVWATILVSLYIKAFYSNTSGSNERLNILFLDIKECVHISARN